MSFPTIHTPTINLAHYHFEPGPGSLAAIEVTDLTVAYQDKPVLWDVDVNVPAGILMAIVGPNGAGKTTLLKTILGLLKPAAGQVRIFGKPFALQRHLVGYVPQRGSVDWDFPTSVLEVVMMGRYRLLGWVRRPGKAEREAALAALEHDLTDFPLVGLHAVVPCHECHTARSYKGAAHDCHGCHQRDDRHEGALGKDCEGCHSPSGWALWQFDHAKATGFALEGAHTRATCGGCHRQPPEVVKLSGDCASCHVQDDVHLGQFGRQCQRCHGSVTSKGARMR